MTQPLRTLFAAIVVLMTGASAQAHEFWIDPESFVIETGTSIAANLRVGQDFAGSALSYIPRNFSRFEIAQGDAIAPVDGRLGDRPALQVEAGGDGLAIVLYETTETWLTYRDWAVFERFTTHKDFAHLQERHRARGLPQTGFTEVYTRHAKSLIAVGTAPGQDRAFGLRTEFVALANPYTDALTDGLPVRLLFEGAPRADAQVELWDRAPDGTVTVTLHRTDAQGEVLLPVQPGHVYMADAVAMIERAPEEPHNAVWQSLWASLTFHVPEH